jgi:hypothetical protein
MKNAALALTLMLAGAPTQAGAACAPMRFGYTNLHSAPYYLGDGVAVPEPAGASIELVREMAAAAHCPLLLARMPVARRAVALDGGLLDAAPIDALSPSPNIALPLDAHGQPDVTRGLHLYTMVFVRAADRVARDVDTAAYLRGRRVGLTHGAANAALFRQAGIDVDDGAASTWRNFDKLGLRRIDAVAVSLTSPGDMDAALAARHGQDFIRLEKPLRVSHLWLGVHRRYYDQNRAAVETMWTWLGAKGEQRFTQLLKKYDKDAEHASPTP